MVGFHTLRSATEDIDIQLHPRGKHLKCFRYPFNRQVLSAEVMLLLSDKTDQS